MKFERSRDFALIRRIVTEPRSYRAASDDRTPSPEDFVLNESEAVWYVIARDAGELLGLFAFTPQNAVCWEIHCCLLPAAWGRSAEALRGAIAWVFANTECRRIVGSTPAYLRLAVKMAAAAGMEPYGINRRSFLRGGMLHDQILSGIGKE